MEAWGWHEDTPTKFDDFAANEGFKARQNETDSGASWEISGPLFSILRAKIAIFYHKLIFV